MKVVASKIEKFSPEIEPWAGRLIESRDAIKGRPAARLYHVTDPGRESYSPRQSRRQYLISWLTSFVRIPAATNSLQERAARSGVPGPMS